MYISVDPSATSFDEYNQMCYLSILFNKVNHFMEREKTQFGNLLVSIWNNLS